jgi:hypothetical protein
VLPACLGAGLPLLLLPWDSWTLLATLGPQVLCWLAGKHVTISAPLTIPGVPAHVLAETVELQKGQAWS